MSDPTLETNVLDELPDDGAQPAATSPTPTEHETPPAEPSQPDDLRSAMTELAGTVSRLAQPKEEAQPAPTPEQIADFWKVYDPEATDKEFFRKFFRLNPEATEEDVKAVKELFAGMQRGLMMQAVTAARNYITDARRQIDLDYGPLRDYVEEAQRADVRGRFYGLYPGLNEGRYQKIIDATARSLDNKVFEDESAYFKALAEGAAESIREILPGFDLGSKPKEPKKPGQPPKLPRTSAGGGGGAGKGGHDALQPTGSRNDIDTLEEDA